MSDGTLHDLQSPSTTPGSGIFGPAGGAGSAVRRRKTPSDRIKAGSTPRPLPLAEAAERLRGRAGRPRKHPERSHVAVTSFAQVRAVPRPAARRSDATSTALPRLLGVEAAGRYLGVSTWTVRDLVAGRQLHPVRLALPSGKAVRRLLFDRVQLDLLIEASSSR
jgi:hypothetical protein